DPAERRMSAFHPHLLERRLRLTRTVVLGAGAAFVLVFFRTQILDHSKYQLQSETNRLRPISLPAPRGIITDRNGKILAENLTGYTVSLLPAEDEDSLEATLRRMAPIVKLDGPAIERLLTRYRRTPYLPVTVLPNATFEVVSALEERRLIFPGLLIQPEPRRHYPDSSLVAHLVGYVGEVTEAERGAVLALKPNSGEILALFSAPGVDPNAFVGGVEPHYWRRLNVSEAHPLFDRTIQARYPPGSTWKLALAAMALRRGIVTLRS